MLYFDIETAALPEALSLLPEPKPPANYKDPAKIEEWKADALAKRVKDAALDRDCCRVTHLGFAHNDAEVEVVYGEEREVLERWWQEAGRETRYCGYNVLGFDLPILIRRSWLLGIKPSRFIPLKRYQTAPVLDLMQVLYDWGGATFRDLGTVCKLAGVEALAPELSGKQWESLSPEEMARHCAADVEMTRALARSTREWYWQ
jgi:hypothetical protein